MLGSRGPFVWCSENQQEEMHFSQERKKLTCPAVNDSQASGKVGENRQLREGLAGLPRRYHLKRWRWPEGQGPVRELRSPHTQWSLCHSLTMNVPWSARRIVLPEVKEESQPCLRPALLINCEFLESVCVCACVCTHGHHHVPVADFIFIGYFLLPLLLKYLGLSVLIYEKLLAFLAFYWATCLPVSISRASSLIGRHLTVLNRFN